MKPGSSLNKTLRLEEERFIQHPFQLRIPLQCSCRLFLQSTWLDLREELTHLPIGRDQGKSKPLYLRLLKTLFRLV